MKKVKLTVDGTELDCVTATKEETCKGNLKLHGKIWYIKYWIMILMEDGEFEIRNRTYPSIKLQRIKGLQLPTAYWFMAQYKVERGHLFIKQHDND